MDVVIAFVAVGALMLGFWAGRDFERFRSRRKTGVEIEWRDR